MVDVIEKPDHIAVLARYIPFGGANFATYRPLGQIEAWLMVLSKKWSGPAQVECQMILTQVRKYKRVGDPYQADRFISRKSALPGIVDADFVGVV